MVRLLDDVVAEKRGQMATRMGFYVRIGNGPREINDAAEHQRLVASGWGSSSLGRGRSS